MAEKLVKTLTVEYPQRMRSLPTTCGVLGRFSVNELTEERTYNALWDTGADGSVISNSIVTQLGLIADGKIRVYHADGMSLVNTYTIDLRLPCGVTFRNLVVTCGDLMDTDILVGMDVISMGDFAITAADGKTKFSFQIPSTHNIDFNK